MVKVTRTGGTSSGVDAPQDTPTKRAIALSSQQHTFTDENGDEYVVQSLDKGEFLLFTRLMGADASSNLMWMNNALVVAAIRSINGKSFILPKTPQMVEERIKIVSDDAIEQINAWVSEMAARRANAEAEREAAKN